MRALPLRIQSAGLAVERRGRSAKIAAVVLAISLLGFGAVASAYFGSYEQNGDLLFALFVSLAVWLTSASALLRHRFTPARSAASTARSRGELTLGEEGLSVIARRSSRSYRPGDVVDGWIDDPGEIISVVLRTRGGDVISVEVATFDEARAILLAAGVAAEQRVLKMRLANAMTQIPLGGGIAALGSVVLPIVGIFAAMALFAGSPDLGARATATLILGLTALAFALLVRALIPPQVLIGTDGITVERILGRVFIPYDQVTQVSSALGAVVLEIRGARSRRLPTGARYGGSPRRAEESFHTALLTRIHHAMAAGRLGSSRDGRAGELDRAGRSFDAWRQHLRGLTSDASYRRLGIASEAIAAVLEDASAPPERRVAAALALAPVGDAALELRIQDVVRASADEGLRAALQAAVDDELTEAELSPLLRRKVR
jgi:hypothetical protein